jgi:hypothetical protein
MPECFNFEFRITAEYNDEEAAKCPSSFFVIIDD